MDIETVLNIQLNKLNELIVKYKGSFSDYEDRDGEFEPSPLSIVLGCEIIFDIAEKMDLTNICGSAEIYRRRALKLEESESELSDAYFDAREKEYREYVCEQEKKQCQALTVAKQRCGHLGKEVKNNHGRSIRLCSTHIHYLNSPDTEIPEW